MDAHLAAVVASFQKLLYHRRARLFFAAAFFNGLDRALKAPELQQRILQAELDTVEENLEVLRQQGKNGYL